jgi:hypothetical protein
LLGKRKRKQTPSLDSDSEHSGNGSNDPNPDWTSDLGRLESSDDEDYINSESDHDPDYDPNGNKRRRTKAAWNGAEQTTSEAKVTLAPFSFSIRN